MLSKLLLLVLLALYLTPAHSADSRLLTAEEPSAEEEVNPADYAPQYHLSEEYLKLLGDIEYQFSGHRGESMWDYRPEALEEEEKGTEKEEEKEAAEVKVGTGNWWFGRIYLYEGRRGEEGFWI